MTAEEIKKLIRDVPDFPKPGIMFRDFTPLIADARGFAAVVDQLAQPYLGKADVVLGIESRGFIVGAPVAYRLGVGLVIARKPGKLPSQTVNQAYDLEYGSASLQMHQDALQGLGRVLLVDDLLATGRHGCRGAATDPQGRWEGGRMRVRRRTRRAQGTRAPGAGQLLLASPL